jgi:hypothetical protein
MNVMVKMLSQQEDQYDDNYEDEKRITKQKHWWGHYNNKKIKTRTLGR